MKPTTLEQVREHMSEIEETLNRIELYSGTREQIDKLIDCARALEEMTARFYCPGDSVYENAMGALAKLKACK